MSKESAEQFLADLSSGATAVDQEAIAKLDEQAIHAYVLDQGYDFTATEMLEVVMENRETLGIALSNEELQSIAGGKGMNGEQIAGVATGAAAGVALGASVTGIAVAAAASAATAGAASIAATSGVVAAGALAAASCF